MTSHLRRYSRQSGFTIVELLIVIVVIGILAAIVIVAYNGIQNSAKRTSAAAQVRQWGKLIELHKNQYDYLSTLPNGYYCLGTDYVSNQCRQPGHATYGYAESTGTPIIAELSKVGTPPLGKTITTGPYTSPYLEVQATRYRINVLLSGTSVDDCRGAGLTHNWISSGGQIVQCHFDIQK